MLSADEGSIESRYDVVVIGSGYGGAIAASRFARAGKRVCLLERGAERWPGDYPENLWSAARDTQIHARGRRYGSPLSLYDMRFDDEVNVLVGCGLGGTSLINASVALRPLGAVFEDQRWPTEIRELGGDGLAPYFERAERWLGSNPYPAEGPSLPKLEALGVIAESLGVPMERAPVNVTFGETTNAAGVTQPACNNCGNCISGCNVGSKNTVLMNYLPDAAHHGAQIFTERSVDWIEEGPGRRSDSSALWRVVFHQVGSGRRRFHAPRQFVHADLVVVAAGTMGSTEIMLRSRERVIDEEERCFDRSICVAHVHLLLMVAATDAGRQYRTREYGTRLTCPALLVDRRRPRHHGATPHRREPGDDKIQRLDRRGQRHPHRRRRTNVLVSADAARTTAHRDARVGDRQSRSRT